MKTTTAALLVILLTATFGCGKNEVHMDANAETAISGAVIVQVDEEILSVIQAAKKHYDLAYPNAHITIEPLSAVSIVNLLVRHDIRGAVVARDYTMEEDTTITAREGIDGFPKTLLARDALVLIASKKFPYDTMHAPDVAALLRGDVKLLDRYTKLTKGITFLVPGSSSSVYGNVVSVVTKGITPAKNALYSAGSKDSLVKLIRNSANRIGFGYMSQYINDTSVKMIRLSYADSLGEYVSPKPVHASYLIMGKYPFPVNIYFILRDKAQPFSLPSGFMQYLARDGKAQKAFLDAGIEPGYAKIELVLPE
ncbi:MAG: substrate-binding domain-containing protein [Ignavibacteria bacterium]|nr:substrate-binding domain-containing protein [Ignavibacteria bacterium]